MKKRILVFSDSHGNAQRLEEAFRLALRKGPADMAVFLGDGWEDFEALRPLLDATHTEALAVAGNRDWFCANPESIEFTVNGACFYACHGHTHHVKYGLQNLYYAAREINTTAALYGHTHIPSIELVDGILLLNPGSVADEGSNAKACAEIIVDDRGLLHPDFIEWESS